jgi:hypothetical protein
MFTGLLPRTPTALFLSFRTRSRWWYYFFYYFHFYFIFIFKKHFYLTTFLSCRPRFLDASQAQWNFLLKHMCGVMTAKKRCNSLWIVELKTLWYVGFQPFFLLSYNFLQFDEFIFSFHDTYNSHLKERYKDNLSTYPNLNLDLWLEAGSSRGLIEIKCTNSLTLQSGNLRTTHSVSTIVCLQSVPSIQTPEFEALLN